MSINDFFKLFLEEIGQNPNLRYYYKFLNTRSKSIFEFRKRYFIQRLRYIENHIPTGVKDIWDCGSGFGTTAIFLALNGYNVYGNTLENYYEQIPSRLDFWKKHGNLDGLTFDYKDLFDHSFNNRFGLIITQDMLHHLEPCREGLIKLRDSLTADGRLMAVEINGSNLYASLGYFIQRGNKRVIEIFDEKLGRSYLLGNENIRPFDKWDALVTSAGLSINRDSMEYIRLFWPPVYPLLKPETMDRLENNWWKRSALLRHYFYFGLNFTCSRVG